MGNGSFILVLLELQHRWGDYMARSQAQAGARVSGPASVTGLLGERRKPLRRQTPTHPQDKVVLKSETREGSGLSSCHPWSSSHPVVGSVGHPSAAALP